MIVIINYGFGNFGSMLNMLKKIGLKAIVSSNIDDIRQASKLILLGIGSFDIGMKNINELGFLPVLEEQVVQKKKPFLGICLGMQLLTKNSEEGHLPGFGWIDATTIRFKFGNKTHLKIPHMGWNSITLNKESTLFSEMDCEPRFYFVHSYHVICNNEDDILTKTTYGYEFVSAVQKENITGVQFHPEKSHKYGMKFLKNFVKM